MINVVPQTRQLFGKTQEAADNKMDTCSDSIQDLCHQPLSYITDNRAPLFPHPPLSVQTSILQGYRARHFQ